MFMLPLSTSPQTLNRMHDISATSKYLLFRCIRRVCRRRMRYTVCSLQTVVACPHNCHDSRIQTRCLVLLHIALQEGFHRDDVRVSVDAREALVNDDLTTRRQTGYAASVEIEVTRSPVVVEVVLTKRGVTQGKSVSVDGPTYVGLSLTAEGSLVWKISQQPFGYL